MITYRRELDGLRALALVTVLLFHAGFQIFTGGYVGVDVFFVLSGYLVTAMILSDVAQDRFSLIGFYERRVRRILPALLCVLAVTTPLAWLWLPPDDLKNFSETLIGSALFSSNFVFWRQSGYFDQQSAYKPLLHTWSLSVEEQFYFIFPIFLTLLWKRGKSVVMVLLSILGVLSFACAVWLAIEHLNFSFYMLPTRAWELAIGALIACFMLGKNVNDIASSKMRNAWSMLGIGLIVYAMLILQSDWPHQNIYKLIPVVGSALVILFTTEDSIIGRGLSQDVIAGIGKISYGAYLWHQPLFVFARYRSLNEPSKSVLLVLIGCSVLLGYLSWKLVEAPIRSRRYFNRKQIFLYCGLGLLVFAGIGAFGALSPRDDRLFWLNGSIPTKFMGLLDKNGVNCSNRDPRDACLLGSGEPKKTIAIVGDSNARVLSESINEMAVSAGYRILEMTRSSCPFLVGLNVYQDHLKDECDEAYQRQRLLKLTSLGPSIVVLHARWPAYIHGRGYDNGVGGIEPASDFFAAKSIDADAAVRTQNIDEALTATVEALVHVGHKVILVDTVPPIGWEPIRRIMRIDSLGIGQTFAERVEHMKTPVDRVELYRQSTTVMIDRLVERFPGLVVKVDPTLLFCNTSAHSCLSIAEHQILYSDQTHLSKEGAHLVALEIFAKLK